MRKPRRFWAIVCALAAVLGAAAWLGFRSGSAPELQRFKLELKNKGEKLTLAELGAGRCTNGDCMRVLTNTVHALNQAAFQPGGFEFRQMVAPGKALVGWKAPSPPYPRAPMRWDQLIQQVDEQESLLSDLRRALEHPAEDGGPVMGLFRGGRVDFVAIRSAAQWLACATMTALHKGDLNLALQDLEALLQMAQLNRSEYTLVAQMIRVSVGRLGEETTWEALQAQGWTEPQLQSLQQAWEKLDFLDAVETGFIGERDNGLEYFQAVRTSNGSRLGALLNPNAPPSFSFAATIERVFSGYIWMPLYKATSIDSDELFYLRAMQDSLQTVRMLKQGETWNVSRQPSDAALARVLAVSKQKISFRYRFSMIAIPNFGRAAITALRSETERRMLVTAIALERFKLRHGAYPPTLETLSPEFLSRIPQDPMSGKPLVYKLKPDGTFLLYSVGEDGKDDGGDPAWTGGGKSNLWEARDAVWPAADDNAGAAQH